ncbi:MAG: ParB/RepB/Spo0J family partition protein [Wolinella succinogenes]|uniref:ParB/RepB/Spo0J family partition protein n=1 Tax=Wolinella succinogenes TaxID=844 RepID=UPI0016AE746B|nr:ParB/RepB/Spo0J family partition protein [Wolinella succinogenes]NLU34011.1 ParB/RepB/Spo0J family partition protein [Wolinella succinogenes]
MMAAKKSLALGRGLGAILGEVEKAYENDLNDNSDLVVELDVHSIKPNPFQPRKHFDTTALEELASSIKEHGLLQPILVFADDEEGYSLIAGERRLRASKLAGFSTIKAIIVDIKTERLREVALIENIQREDLNPIDLAQSYKELIEDYGITHEELAKKISKSRTQITNTLRLLTLSLEVQEQLLEGKITQGHAKVLVGLAPEEQKVALDSIIGQRLSVRETESLIKNLKETPRPSSHPSRTPSNPLVSQSSQSLLELVMLMKQKGFKASLKGTKIVLDFEGEEEVKRLIKSLSSLSF